MNKKKKKKIYNDPESTTPYSKSMHGKRTRYMHLPLFNSCSRTKKSRISEAKAKIFYRFDVVVEIRCSLKPQYRFENFKVSLVELEPVRLLYLHFKLKK